MVIKKITSLRKKEFKNNIMGIIAHINNLDKIGVSDIEILDFFHRVAHEKEIFSAKFYRDEETGKFVYESNFPNHFEYYEQFITKDATHQENVHDNHESDKSEDPEVELKEDK